MDFPRPAFALGSPMKRRASVNAELVCGLALTVVPENNGNQL
jgi:hypothetical protein